MAIAPLKGIGQFDPERLKEIKEQRAKLPKLRDVAASMKAMGEDTEEMDKALDALEAVSDIIIRHAEGKPIKE